MENQSSYDRITKKFADFFVDFKKVMSSTAYNDPTMCFVVDFYDPSAIFYNKHINIFGDDLPNVSAIDPDKIFKVNEQFKEFIKKCINEVCTNIPDIDHNLKKLYYIASQLVKIMYYFYFLKNIDILLLILTYVIFIIIEKF